MREPAIVRGCVERLRGGLIGDGDTTAPGERRGRRWGRAGAEDRTRDGSVRAGDDYGSRADGCREPPRGLELISRPSLASLRQLRLREHQLFLALSIVVGILAGLSAVLFTVAIDWTTHLLFGLDPSSVRLFLVPVTVSLATGFLI